MGTSTDGGCYNKSVETLPEIESLCVLEHRGNPHPHRDPMPELLRRRWLLPTGNGLFVLADPLVKMLKQIDTLFLELAESVGAKECQMPVILSEDNAKKSQYAESFAHQAVGLHTCEGNVSFGLASPTVCYHYFSAIQNLEVAPRELVTAVGTCVRNEKGALSDLSRLSSFTLREIIGIGTANECEVAVTEIKRKIFSLLNSVLELSYDVTLASDPFFGEQSEIKRKAQLIQGGKVEIRALADFLPSPIPIISFNRHHQIFFGRFGIKQDPNQPLESFCVGFGYERILYALLSQKGLD